jgi:hypothetical protein
VYRLLRWIVLVVAAWAVVASVPSIARYLRIRAM